MKPPAWHQLDVRDAAQRLGTDAARGLDAAAAAQRLAADGPNELTEAAARRPITILWEQVTGTMVLVLIAAAVVSAALGDVQDAAAILAIVILNAALGFSQEYRAEQAMAALKQLAVPRVKVRRDGRVQEISARELVPGDLMLLEAGNLVAADGRVVESASLRTQEAALTGESEAVDKITAALPDGVEAVGDQRNMVFMGTAVSYGRGLAVVTGTGMRTELGAIAATLQAVRREPTPLQRRLDELGRGLAVAAVAIVAVIFAIGLLRGEELRLMFLTAVSMAVAAVPEGLPAVVTIALALGAQRMLRRRALIRKLAAVETLGSVTVICSDKTGTLTENRMTAAVLDVAGLRIDLAAEEPSDLGAWATLGGAGSGPPDGGPDALTLALVLAGGALCSDASPPEEAAPGQTSGDPTEVALVVAAARFGLRKADLDRRFPRVAEVPFDADRKRMTTVHSLPGAWRPIEEAIRHADGEAAGGGAPYVAFTKGGVEPLIGISNRVWTRGGPEAMDESWVRRITRAHDELADNGMRVLGVAFRPAVASQPLDTVERDLIFAGLVGIVDPPRAEVRDAVATCTAAGIRTVMITGDHPLTARYVARQLGMDGDGRVVTGAELARMSGEELEGAVDEVAVYARVSPEHKYRIVEALQRRGQVVAMTGDGVNDAPALKKADIGVAMGITGTDVSKEAADTVLLDDNFATIVAAIEEGRIIYDNIRKFVKYLLTTNSAELWLMLVAPLIGMPLPLLPLQILWINLVTDGPTALTLGVEPAERGVMRRPPRPPRESVFAGGLGPHVIWVGVFMAALTITTGYGSWRAGNPEWQTLVFTTLAFSQMAHVLAIRSSRDSLFTVGVLSNPLLALAVAGTVAAQLAVVYVQVLRDVFGTLPLTPGQLGASVGVAAAVFAAVELEKWWLRRRR